MSELVRQFTSQQWKIFHEAIKDAGINTEPWWEAIPYSGTPKVLHWGLFKKCRWFFKVLSAVFKSEDDDDPYRLGKFLIAAHDDPHKLEWLARYIRHTGWTLSLETGQWQLGRGDFVILQRGAFRGGDKRLVIDRLRNLGIEQELVDQALNSQTEEIQGYVLSSTEEEAHALAEVVELGAITPCNASDTQTCMYFRALELCNRGMDHSQRGQQQEAIEALREAIKIDPKYAESYCQLSLVYSEIGCKQEEIETLREGIKTISDEEDLSWLYYHLGIAYGGYAQWEDMIESLKQCSRINSDLSDDIHAYINDLLAIAHSELGKFKEEI